MNLTFLIPVKIESEDRVRNLITVLTYLSSKLEAKLLVYECDKTKKFEQFVSPYLNDGTNKKLKYFFEEQTTSYFHKTKILNNLLQQSDTEVVCNYDTDVLLPESTYHKAYDMIITGQYDAVYPYGCGVYQKAITYSNDTFSKFITSDLNLESLEPYSNLSNSTIGWCQFIRKKNYINSFMMNENFHAWGPEDSELYYRLNILGNKVGRVNDYVYHLEHSRTNDSWFSNPLWRENFNLWNWIRTRSKEEILQYYSNQHYYKQRIKQ